MKIRTGFVSNSSSSSFIINKDEIDNFNNMIETNFYNVYTLIDKFKGIKEKLNTINKMLKDEMPDFIYDDCTELSYILDNIDDYIQNLGKIDNEEHTMFITGAVDRDEAYLRGIEHRVFETDL